MEYSFKKKGEGAVKIEGGKGEAGKAGLEGATRHKFTVNGQNNPDDVS